MTALDQIVTRFQLGDFKRWHVTVADDFGEGPNTFLGGFDTVDDAHSCLDELLDWGSEQVSEGQYFAGDPEVNFYFWLVDTSSDTAVEQGRI